MLVLALGFAPGAPAQEPETPQPELERRIERLEGQIREMRRAMEGAPPPAGMAELRRQIEAITRELEEMRLGEQVTAPPADSAAYGLGPAASRVYRVDHGVSIGGYGEMRYENFASEREDGAPAGRSDRLDFLRGVFYFGYKFDDRFLFNSEIEFEHASTEDEGEVSVEFAYLDWRFHGARGETGLRAGLLLLPMGFINERHEPPTYLGVRRPEVERRLIPSTWRENGIGLFGATSGVEWRVYAVNGFDAVGEGEGGFGAGGLRDGRQSGSEALAEDLAAVARVDWTGTPGLMLGISAYYGGSDQGREDPLRPGESIGAETFIGEAHAEYRGRGLNVRGLVALATVSDVASLNAARGLSGSASIGERLVGGYVQAGYDVLRDVDTTVRLLPYVRYERLDTQSEVPDGFASDPANDRELVTLGAQVHPIDPLALKFDYTFESNGADTGVNAFRASLSYLF